MSATDELLDNNERYADTFALADLPARPGRKVAVVACMDARLDPTGVLCQHEGDAHVLRNAGGVVTDDVIRSLAISQHHLGTEEIILLHHARCGMQTFTDADFADALEQESGQRPTWPARAFSDLEEDVRDSIRRIRESPFVPHTDSVRGFVYDVESGRRPGGGMTSRRDRDNWRRRRPRPAENRSDNDALAATTALGRARERPAR